MAGVYLTRAYLIGVFNGYTFSDHSRTQAKEDVQFVFCLQLNIHKGKCWSGTEVGGGVQG